MILFGETVLAGFVEVFVSFPLPLFPVLCNVSVYMNMTFICFSRIKKLLIERQGARLTASEILEGIRKRSKTGCSSLVSRWQQCYSLL